MTNEEKNVGGSAILGPSGPGYSEILSPDAMEFVADLARTFAAEVAELRAERRHRQSRVDEGELPDFPTETDAQRQADWRVGTIPEDLRDRRVEITGPLDRKLVVNALNADVKCFMADFEDAQSPTWSGLIEGQINLRDALARRIDFTSDDGREYRLHEKPATLIVRMRGWHLNEKHVLIDGQPIPAALFDFGLYLFHNADVLLAAGSGPYFYLPKLESYTEARLWNRIFERAEESLHLSQGAIKVSILIETVFAAFQMDEILYELRTRAVAMNCGRWDYIFSLIKTFRTWRERVLPDRGQISMEQHFLRSYSQLLIKTCHRRGALAIGGMSPFIPVRNDPETDAIAIAQVEADKRRDAEEGFDGVWIAHPGLAEVVNGIYSEIMSGDNQLDVLREDVSVSARDLLELPEGPITENGLRDNVSIAVQYIEAWLRGNGCLPLYNLMEDAGTAEIARTQVWSWIHHDAGVLDSGRPVTIAMFREIMDEEMENIKAEIGEDRFEEGRFEDAREIMDKLSTADRCHDFMTLLAYEYLP